MALHEGLKEHLGSGLTTVCRAWAVVRGDGQSFGFTDHDNDLSFEGFTFKADTGLSANMLEQTTGLSVDNTEALGALTSASVTEEDIRAGRYDNAEVLSWLVNWQDTEQRVLQFRGTFGEITRVGGAFRVELRGLTEALNQPQGRVYQSNSEGQDGVGCFGFDYDTPGYFAEVPVEQVEDGKFFTFENLAGFDERWFERGRFVVQTGAAQGLVGLIKNDRINEDGRIIELWQDLRAPIAPGDMVRMEAGCDGRAETYRLKYNNFINFRGFPHIPGEDWLSAYPRQSSVNDGGSLVSSSGGSDG